LDLSGVVSGGRGLGMERETRPAQEGGLTNDLPDCAWMIAWGVGGCPPVYEKLVLQSADKIPI
jgi:hypothetical protein